MPSEASKDSFFERWKPAVDAPMLVGECNPYGSDPRYAMFPMPEWSAGGRLCNLILSMQASKYLLLFNRANLCTGKWSLSEARLSAQRMANPNQDCKRLILLGAKVCSAFEVPFEPFLASESLLILPHPSGLNRIWNDPNSIQQTRDAVSLFYPEVTPYIGLE